MSQYIAARMIGFCADLLKDELKGPLLEKVRSFCLDQDEDIRSIVVRETLPKICNQVSTELLQTYLFKNVFNSSITY
jgi:serine/threonine-protein phosphatase 4 regulatory subunit 4